MNILDRIFDGDPRKAVWHRWFAWKPVKVNGKWAWMKFVQRKGTKRTRMAQAPECRAHEVWYWAWEYK